MASTIILSDNGASSGSAGLKQTAGNDGVLLLQTTTSGGTATTAVTLDTSQNMGVGVTPSAWSGGKAIEVGFAGNSLWGRYSNEFHMDQGVYYNGTNFIRTGNSAISSYQQYTGIHAWFTGASGTAGNTASLTQAMTLNANGALALQGGNASANGVGIAFPATQSASSDANTLDDYEEGTWTPALSGATFSGTTAGTYVKVGQVITVWGYASLSWSSSTSAFYINNLPFTVYNDTNVRGGAGNVMCQSGVTFNNYVTLEPINNAVNAYFESNTSGTNRTDMGSSNFASGGFVIRFTITYRTSA